MEDKKILAAENHKNGCSCSQAVNLAFCDVTGLSATDGSFTEIL